MSLYEPGLLPEEFDRSAIEEEFRRIAQVLDYLILKGARFEPQAVAPERPQEGDLSFADGTNWNPGSGAGLYEYRGGTWNKL